MLNPHPLHSFHLPNMHAVRNLRHLLAPTRRHSFSISRHLRSSSSAQQWLQSIHIIPADADVPGASRAPTPPDPAESAVGVSGADEPEDPPSGGDASVLRAEPDRGVRTTVSPGVVFQRSERKKRGKEKMAWVCNNCGVSRGQWWGMCPSCKEWDTARKVADCERTGGFEAEVRGWLPRDAGGEEPQSLVDINKGMSDLEWRLPLPGIFGMEVARVLGGGVVPGSLILVGGDPGVGKSTLLLQIAGVLSEENGTKGSGRVLYVSGEESIDQIKNRADRMGITSNGIFLCSSTDIKDILEKVWTLSPQALIVDSVQTVYLEGISGSAGNLMQVKECTSALLRFAKQTNIPIFLIGHVTKTGDLAGPRALEHIVDAVLYMEGERNSSYRLLRSVKNRFGSTDELGVFEMSQSGLKAVLNPSEMFLSESHFDLEVLAGLAVSVILDGSRSFLIEIQALCVPDSSNPWHFNGVQKSRAEMIVSVLMKQVGLKLQGFAIYLNVVSGFKLTETAGDLAVAAAICSSFLEFAIPHDVAFIGEVGLGGELRTVPRMDKRLIAVSKLGFKTCIIPASALKSLNDVDTSMKIMGCRNLKEVIQAIRNYKDENGGRAVD